MELGRVHNIENERVNQVERSTKVKEIDKDTKIIDHEEYKKANKDQEVIVLNEVVIDNIKFGYNKASKDFFIKVTRGDAEFRYPTEDMMKVKAHLLAEVAKIIAEENKI
ncbi:MAG: flagellin [Campylobacteraceae bacterium]|nr:flagellin [Campylobacteraceae bacterium]